MERAKQVQEYQQKYTQVAYFSVLLVQVSDSVVQHWLSVGYSVLL